MTILHTPKSSTLGLVSAQSPRQYVKRHIVQTAEHFMAADCKETGCPHYEFGWTTTIDEQTDLGRKQARYIRKEAKRKYTEQNNAVGLTLFYFESGQKCFTAHKVQTGEAPIKLVTKADGRMVRQEAQRWFGEANEEVYRFQKQRKEGGY